MSHPAIPAAEDVIDAPAKAQFETFLDQHRAALNLCLDGLTEQQARRSLVPSKTTLLGLVKHATFVEKVWFNEAVACRSRDELGIQAGPTSPSTSTTTTPSTPSVGPTVRRARPRARRSQPSS